METFSAILPVIGIALCVLACCQLALWTAGSWGNFKTEKNHFQKQQSEFRGLLSRVTNARTQSSPFQRGNWRGYRTFRVDRLERETATIISVYLVPADAKPIARFQPGQYLTFRFQIPDVAKPVVRCYSLSDGPHENYYRISVKEVPPPPDRLELEFGKASQYINRNLQVGQTLEVKAPAGDFFLQPDSEKPIVLLAGGIGITPMISMLQQLIATKTARLVLLVYGVNQGTDHAFKLWLQETAGLHPWIHQLICYSQPAPTDRLGLDYHFSGRVSVGLLAQLLPHSACEFYLCGPPPFMKSLYEGLLAWDVPRENIYYEAFGPASIGPSTTEAASIPDDSVTCSVRFAKSAIVVNWDGSQRSLLDLAEAHGIVVDSGCRAGSCGSCRTELLSGTVEYPNAQKPDCPASHCLLCLARPQGPLELGA